MRSTLSIRLVHGELDASKIDIIPPGHRQSEVRSMVSAARSAYAVRSYSDPVEEKVVADQDSNRSPDPKTDRKQNEDNNEWLRDQVGEDHNLSGSSTYRTLPDQPEGDAKTEGDEDARSRQSNR
jgi:hypothetical protein